jgi:hypothetical protein
LTKVDLISSFVDESIAQKTGLWPSRFLGPPFYTHSVRRGFLASLALMDGLAGSIVFVIVKSSNS